MGDLKLDLSKSGAYKYVAWGCAALGAAGGIYTAGTATISGAIIAGAAGAIAGTVLVPAMAAAVGVTGFLAIKGLAKFIKNEGIVIPLATGMIAVASLKALAEPFVKLAGLRKAFNSAKAPAPKPSANNPPPPAPGT